MEIRPFTESHSISRPVGARRSGVRPLGTREWLLTGGRPVIRALVLEEGSTAHLSQSGVMRPEPLYFIISRRRMGSVCQSGLHQMTGAKRLPLASGFVQVGLWPLIRGARALLGHRRETGIWDRPP